MKYRVSWKSDLNFMPYIWPPLVSLPSNKPPHLHHQAKKNLGWLYSWYIQSPSIKAYFIKLEERLEERQKILKWGCPFPRTGIINYHKLGGLRQQNLFSYFDIKSLKWNIGRNASPLDILGENQSCLFQLVEAAGVSWLWQRISNMRSSSLWLSSLCCLCFLFLL